MIILEVGNKRYIGGAMTATGYGVTSNRNLAISFGSLDEALCWMADNGVDACPIDYATDKPVMCGGI